MDNKIKIFKGKYGPLLIAEIGGNHQGDFEYAKKLTQLAIDANVDYIKFQIYSGDMLVSQIESPVRNSHFKKFELTKDQHIQLAEMIKKAGIKYTSSVWDLDSMKWIDSYMDFYKIGSGDLTAYPVLKKIAKTGKPIVLSTGLSTEKEVLETVKYIQSVNDVYLDKEMLAILQCTSMYPINPDQANLDVIKTYKSKTGLTVGYSDHTIGKKALSYAFAMGAQILEFHFTDNNKNRDFRDHLVSLDLNDVDELIKEITLIRDLKGSGEKKPTTSEIDSGHLKSFRRSVYPSRDIKKGEILNDENLTVLRPVSGIDAREFDNLIGKTLTQDVIKHQRLDLNLIK